MTLADVSPAILAQLAEDPEERYWFVWDRGADWPWRHCRSGCVEAFAFESDAAHRCAVSNGRRSPSGLVCDGFPRLATLQEALDARPDYRPIALFDRDLNLVRRLA